MANIPYDSRYVLSSLNNALKVLELLMNRDEVTLGEISKIVELNRTTIFKMLYTMERRGFVTKTNKKYKLGNKMCQYGNIASQRQNIADVAGGFMLRLRANTGQAVGLYALNTSGKIVIVNEQFGSNESTISGRIGGEMDWYTNSAGKVLLAYSPSDVQSAIINNTVLKSYTSRTVTSLADLKQQLIKIKGIPFTQCTGENNLCHGDIAAPLFDFEGNCIAALGLTYEVELLDNRLEFFCQQVQNTAVQISTAMGFKGCE